MQNDRANLSFMGKKLALNVLHFYSGVLLETPCRCIICQPQEFVYKCKIIEYLILKYEIWQRPKSLMEMDISRQCAASMPHHHANRNTRGQFLDSNAK